MPEDALHDIGLYVLRHGMAPKGMPQPMRRSTFKNPRILRMPPPNHGFRSQLKHSLHVPEDRLSIQRDLLRTYIPHFAGRINSQLSVVR